MSVHTVPQPPPASRRRAARQLAGWTACLCAAALLLTLTLRGLEPPPTTVRPAAWNDWVISQDPEDAVAAVVAPVALVLVLGTGLVVLVAGAAVATAARRGRPVRCSERWPTALSTFVATTTLLAGGAVAPGAGAVTGSGARAGGEVAARPVVALDVAPAAPEAPPAPAPATESAPAPMPSPASGPAPVPPRSATYLVRPGDNLWRIAEHQVALRPELGPTVRYWLRLIDANWSRFVEPGNPDLILPGQELALPGQ